MAPLLGWDNLLVALTVALLATVLLTYPVSAVLLIRYRASVARAMSAASGAALRAAAASSAEGTATRPGGDAVRQARTGSAGPSAQRSPVALRLVQRPEPPGSALGRQARRTVLLAQGAYGAAALTYGCVSALLLLVLGDSEVTPVRLATLTLGFGWLLVPTVLSVGLSGRRLRAALLASWIAGIPVLTALAGGTVWEGLVFAAQIIGLPALCVVLTSPPWARGAAWLVAPAVFAVTAVAMLLYPAYLILARGVPLDASIGPYLLVAVGILAGLLAYVWVTVTRYAHHRISDQGLQFRQWWFIVTALQALLAGLTVGAQWTLAYVVPFLLFLLLAGLLLKPLRVEAQGRRPAKILLLRTFGDRRRSTRLLRDVTVSWRWVGNVELIAGVDLASETLEPDEFLDWLRGRAGHHFVASAADLATRLANRDPTVDADGRYRVTEYFCHDDTWRMTVTALAARSDAVLFDLRRFGPAHRGVTQEIRELVAGVDLARVVVLVDDTTDLAALRRCLDEAAAAAPLTSPLVRAGGSDLGVLRIGTDRLRDGHRVLDALATSASAPTRV